MNKEFLEFLLCNDALKFGEFILKSGRISPFFMNLGLICDGFNLSRLGEFYAKKAYEIFGDEIDVFYGPAYKGIPLAVITSEAFNRLYKKSIKFCSNRKEIKDHGDKGILLGHNLKKNDRVVIIEDVTTSGKSIDENMSILKEFGANVLGLVVSLNRCERGKKNSFALDEIANNYNIKTASILNMLEVIDFLRKNKINNKFIINDEVYNKLLSYYKEFGIN